MKQTEIHNQRSSWKHRHGFHWAKISKRLCWSCFLEFVIERGFHFNVFQCRHLSSSKVTPTQFRRAQLWAFNLNFKAEELKNSFPGLCRTSQENQHSYEAPNKNNCISNSRFRKQAHYIMQPSPSKKHFYWLFSFLLLLWLNPKVFFNIYSQQAFMIQSCHLIRCICNKVTWPQSLKWEKFSY